MIKALDNRFYVKFMQLKIGLLVGALSYIIVFSVKVGDKSLIIHKSAYHLFSLLISKRGFSSLQTRKTFGKILSGNSRFLIPVVRVTTHNCAYLLHPTSDFCVT